MRRQDIDIDGDDWSNDMEYDCGSDPLDNSSVPNDTDNDGLAVALMVMMMGMVWVMTSTYFPTTPSNGRIQTRMA